VGFEETKKMKTHLSTNLIKYPTYKDSGVEYLGRIPFEWVIGRLKNVFIIINGSTPKSTNPEYWDGDIVWITPEDLGNLKGNTIVNSARKITRDGYLSCGTSIAVSGSLVISTRAPIGHLAISGVDFLVIRPQLESLGRGSTFTELGKSELGDVEIFIPPFPEQRAIADFLDRETARIDTLIAKYQRLIELLEEKRSCLISQVVTTGIDNLLGMKETGISWLPLIPNNWEIIKNKNLLYEIDERSINGDEELLSVSHLTGVTPRSEKDVNMFMAESTVGYKLCNSDDLVINTMWAWMGALGVSKYNGIVSPSYNVYRFINKCDVFPQYMDLFFRTRAYVVEINRNSKGIWSSRLRLYPDEFLNMWSLVPPYEEQIEIVAFIKQQTGKTFMLTKMLSNMIEKLKEYRTALISEVVTGKIDVRN
jgi:type I restriction enzyme, S subunit